MTDKKEKSHIAYARQRIGRRFGPWLEIGWARVEEDGSINVILDRTPIGGFNGHAFLAPVGGQPPEPEQQHPDEAPEAEDN